MYSWDIADCVAAHFERPSQEVSAAMRDELERLRAGLAAPELPPAARERLIEEAAERIHARVNSLVDGELADRLAAVLAARKVHGLEGVRAELDHARRALRECDAYLQVAPGWAEGCELVTRVLQRAVLRATIALGDAGDAAAAAVVTADVEHAALTLELAAYARASSARTQTVAHAFGHHAEASYLVLRVIELASLG